MINESKKLTNIVSDFKRDVREVESKYSAVFINTIKDIMDTWVEYNDYSDIDERQNEFDYYSRDMLNYSPGLSIGRVHFITLTNGGDWRVSGEDHNEDDSISNFDTSISNLSAHDLSILFDGIIMNRAIMDKYNNINILRKLNN